MTRQEALWAVLSPAARPPPPAAWAAMSPPASVRRARRRLSATEGQGERASPPRTRPPSSRVAVSPDSPQTGVMARRVAPQASRRSQLQTALCGGRPPCRLVPCLGSAPGPAPVLAGTSLTLLAHEPFFVSGEPKVESHRLSPALPSGERRPLAKPGQPLSLKQHQEHHLVTHQKCRFSGHQQTKRSETLRTVLAIPRSANRPGSLTHAQLV